MIKRPKFSIIVPIYNVEKYLSRCLQSLVDQTLHDIEIICINDGSTDKSLDIIKMFAEKDSRIVVIDKKNQGVSAARNAGINVAEGEYFLFVDSDDYLSENACDRLYMEVLQTGADLVIFGTRVFPLQTEKDVGWLYHNLDVRQVNYHDNAVNALFNERSSKPFIWHICFRRSLFKSKDIKFDEEIALGEDMVFLFKVFPKASEISYIPDQLYNYRAERKNSLMTQASEHYVKRMEWHLIIIRKVFEYWQKKGLLEDHRLDLGKWALDLFYPDLSSGVLDEHEKTRVANAFLKTFHYYRFDKVKYDKDYKAQLKEIKMLAV